MHVRAATQQFLIVGTWCYLRATMHRDIGVASIYQCVLGRALHATVSIDIKKEHTNKKQSIHPVSIDTQSRVNVIGEQTACLAIAITT